MKRRDLTEIIGKHRSKAYVGRALNLHWDLWGQYERDDTEASQPRLRRLSRQARAEHYGLKLSV